MTEQSVQMVIPRQWPAGVPDEVVPALSLYHDGVGALGYIAEQLKLPKRALIREACLREIEPQFSEESIGEDLV